MPSEENSRLVGGALSSSSSATPGTQPKQPSKATITRGLLCWAIFGAFLVFFIIMAAVYTDPKRYKAATPVAYLSGEDAALYKGLGQAYFVPTTRKMSAMATFQLGLQLLHMFWYDLALVKFQQARTMDPKLAMAYWGEAMCYKQPLWQTENVTAAQGVISRMDKAVALAALSDRERSYLTAVRALFAPGKSLQERESDYSTIMAALSGEYQDDPDACAFAALSLLGKAASLGGYLTPDQAYYARDQAEELLGDCSHYYPKHAGLLSYTVYLYDVDDVAVAAKGVAPALALAAAAPASSRAQHMRSHIFLRFGNWSQVVAANQAAVAASDSYCAAVKANNTCDADNRWHALEWQLYGQTQQCGVAAATVSYKGMQSVAASANFSADYGQWLYRTYAHVTLQSLGWGGALPLRGAADNATDMLPPPLYDTASIEDLNDIGDHFWPPHAEAHALLARVYVLVANRTSAQLAAPGVQATVSAALARLDVIVARQTNLTAAAATGGSAAATGGVANAEMATLLTTVQLQARALVDASACVAAGGPAASPAAPACATWRPAMDSALALHTTIAASQTLPSLKIAPTPEWYGNLLIATATDPAAAATLYGTCLDQLPGRMQCVLGMARALRAQGQNDAAAAWYRTLAAQCAPGDARFPAVAEARAYGGAAPPPPPAGGRKGARRALASAA